MAKLRVDKIASVGVSTETTGSVFFDSSNNNHLAIQDHPDLEIHTNCTFECFINFDSVPTSQTFFLGKTDSFWIAYDSTAVGGTADRFTFAIFDGSSWTGTTSSFGSAPTAGRWYHLAAVKEGTSMKLYVDGKLYGSNTFSGTPDDTTNNFNVLWGSNNTFDGYVSNVRFIKDRAFYTSDFAAPTRELEVVDGTVLLCCYDGENIFADKTGNHIIRAVGDRTSSPTPTATDSPIGITTENPGLIRDVDNTFGPTFQGGAAYASQNWLTLPKGTTTERMPDFGAVDAASARGLFGGGFLASPVFGSNHIDYITISTLSNSQDFGDLFTGTYNIAAVSSRTRGVWAGGQESPSVLTNAMQYVTISSTGDAADFGDLDLIRQNSTGASNSTRGLWMGGNNPGTTPNSVLNAIEMITIQSTGNTQDFGDLTEAVQAQRSCASPTRALRFGGSTSGASGGRVQTIDYVTISTTGNAVAFGDLEAAAWFHGACSNSTRGINFGNNPATNVIDFVTLATLGNAQDFGFLSETFTNCSAVSSSTRAVMADAQAVPMEFITIATTGNSQDFGSFTNDIHNIGAGCGNGHGGLG